MSGLRDNRGLIAPGRLGTCGSEFVMFHSISAEAQLLVTRVGAAGVEVLGGSIGRGYSFGMSTRKGGGRRRR